MIHTVGTTVGLGQADTSQCGQNEKNLRIFFENLKKR
jgi:hypothetical protein